MNINNLEEINDYLTKQSNCVIDGAMNLDKYENSKFKILWVLKEPYSDDGEGFNYNELFLAENLYEDFFKNVAVPTWHPIIYISYSILNNFKKWEELDYIRDNNEMCNVINEIALINANKDFSKTGTYTLEYNLIEGFEKYKAVCYNQIKFLNPEIIIFGATFELFEEILQLNNDFLVFDDYIMTKIYKKDGKFYISTKHPAARVKRANYINSIVDYLKSELK
jgi:hypothetical protein